MTFEDLIFTNGTRTHTQAHAKRVANAAPELLLETNDFTARQTLRQFRKCTQRFVRNHTEQMMMKRGQRWHIGRALKRCAPPPRIRWRQWFKNQCANWIYDDGSIVPWPLIGHVPLNISFWMEHCPCHLIAVIHMEMILHTTS